MSCRDKVRTEPMPHWFPSAGGVLTYVNDGAGRSEAQYGVSAARSPNAMVNRFSLSCPMTKTKSLGRPDHDLEAEALTALEEARALSHGPERTRAMQKAGKLRNAADLLGIVFARRGRPAKAL